MRIKENETLEITAPEAAVALAALVSFSDDDPSEAEGVILRKYYRYKTAESLQAKLSAAGYSYPTDLPDAEQTIVRALGSAAPEFRLRSLAVAWLLALADGDVDHNELRLLSRYADAVGVALSDVRSLAESGLTEIDERTEDELHAGVPERGSPRSLPELTADQAGITLVCEVAFADDNPSDAEAAVLRDHYRASDVETFIGMIDASGYPYPEALPDLRPAVLVAMRRLSRDEQLRLLAIARLAAGADGQVIPEEHDILKGYCEEFGLGMAEVEAYFRSDPV